MHIDHWMKVLVCMILDALLATVFYFVRILARGCFLRVTDRRTETGLEGDIRF